MHPMYCKRDTPPWEANSAFSTTSVVILPGQAPTDHGLQPNLPRKQRSTLLLGTYYAGVFTTTLEPARYIKYPWIWHLVFKKEKRNRETNGRVALALLAGHNVCRKPKRKPILVRTIILYIPHTNNTRQTRDNSALETHATTSKTTTTPRTTAHGIRQNAYRSQAWGWCALCRTSGAMNAQEPTRSCRNCSSCQ